MRRFDARALVRVALVVAFAALALGSAGVSAPDLVSRLRDERAQFAALGEQERTLALFAHNGMPFAPATFDFYRRELLPGESFAFHFGDAIPASFRRVVEIYGRWHLYPNEFVGDPADADVVLGFRGADVETLGLGFRVQRRHPGGHTVGWRERRG